MIVLDTHVLIWLMEGEARLRPEVRTTIQSAAATRGVHVSAITPWEIALLAQKGRISFGREIAQWMDEALGLPGLCLAPITPSIAIDSVQLPGDFHADPADRLIIATSRATGFALVTADKAMLRYGSQGHVSVVRADE